MFGDQARDRGLAQFAIYKNNPRAFVYDLVRDPMGKAVELEPYQIETLEAIAAGKDVTVRSGHGVGKTTTDALAILWFLTTRPFSKVPTTAPTFRQVKDILWAEIAKWFQTFRIKDQFKMQKTRLSVRGAEEIWFAMGVASNRPENIEGFHAPYILFVVDEAKGVQRAIYDSIDGALTTGGQRLYTSTPGSRLGQFYESHFGNLARYFTKIHVDGEKSRRVSDKWRLQKAEEWGRDSAIYQAKVRGEFPNEGTDILIRLDWILAAEDAFDEADCSTCGLAYGTCAHLDAAPRPAIPHAVHKALGGDVARYGHDETALAYGSSARLGWIESWRKEDTVETSNRYAAAYRRESAREGCDAIGVDDTGLGGGVTDQLIKLHKVPTMPLIFGGKSELLVKDDQERFVNNKAYIAWKFSRALEENFRARDLGKVGTFALCHDDKLKGQLSNLRTRHNEKGTMRILDPDDADVPAIDLPKGVRVSPDRAHAAIICYHTATSAAGRSAGKFVPPAPVNRARHDAKRRLSRYIFGR